MALEAVILQDLFGYNNGKDLYNLWGGNWSLEDHFGSVEKEEILENQTQDFECTNWNYDSVMPHLDQLGPNSFLEPDMIATTIIPEEFSRVDNSARPKRRRSKSKKNKEEIEIQRMTHIAVERNRRKQMNEYISLLRALMPDFYVRRGDQASIIGGAINYIKELEQQLQFLSGQTHRNKPNFEDGSSSSPFAEFFTFPQYSTGSICCANSIALINSVTDESQLAKADIEVTMAESHASLKIRSKKRPKQLLKMVAGLQSLRLTVLHLNVTTFDQVVLYSLSVKVEDDCKLTSVDEIATAVNQMLGRIQAEASLI